MYSEKDFIAIKRRLFVYRLIWFPALAALVALLIFALKSRVQWLTVAASVGFMVAVCFGFTWYQLPCWRYLRFLNDIKNGLSREMAGEILEIDAAAQLQDGARVLPVRLRLQDGGDERIVYLNASKRDQFPEPGANVRLNLCGRHIRAVEQE